MTTAIQEIKAVNQPLLKKAKKITWQEFERHKNSKNIILPFVVEVISPHSLMIPTYKRMNTYRDASVKVVWHILPEVKQVHVYSGNYLDSMIVCTGKIICSAAPVLPDFALSADDVFKGMA